MCHCGGTAGITLARGVLFFSFGQHSWMFFLYLSNAPSVHGTGLGLVALLGGAVPGRRFWWFPSSD
jgi:hypothetical protein